MTPPEFISPEMAIGLSMALPAVGALGVALIGRFVGENARDMWTSLITVLTATVTLPARRILVELAHQLFAFLLVASLSRG